MNADQLGVGGLRFGLGLLLGLLYDSRDFEESPIAGAQRPLGPTARIQDHAGEKLAALDKPTGGEVVLDGRPLSTIPEREIAAFRRSQLGFVFQEFNLLDTFSVQDNIFLPLVLAGKAYPEMAARLAPIARQLGIAELLQKFPYELSGGQKQRVAVARALITQPKLVLADEPTGALDSRATDELLRLFEDVNRGGQTILMVTHSVKAASHASRVLFIKDGEVFHEIYRGESTDEQLYQKISDTLTMLATGGEHHA